MHGDRATRCPQPAADFLILVLSGSLVSSLQLRSFMKYAFPESLCTERPSYCLPLACSLPPLPAPILFAAWKNALPAKPYIDNDSLRRTISPTMRYSHSTPPHESGRHRRMPGFARAASC